jgi:hypothetical protein
LLARREIRTLRLPPGWEDWLAFFAARLPEPVTREDAEDGTVTYLAGDPGEVIVQLSQRAIAVSEFRVRLDASGVPVAIPRLLGRILDFRCATTSSRQLPDMRGLRAANAPGAAASIRRVLGMFRAGTWCASLKMVQR